MLTASWLRSWGLWAGRPDLPVKAKDTIYQARLQHLVGLVDLLHLFVGLLLQPSVVGMLVRVPHLHQIVVSLLELGLGKGVREVKQLQVCGYLVFVHQ